MHAPEQDHNHNLDNVALNYPCHVRRLRIVRHNRARCTENGIHEWSYFYLYYLCRSQHNFGTMDGDWTSLGGPPSTSST
jgi:hypothetical protein